MKINFIKLLGDLTNIKAVPPQTHDVITEPKQKSDRNQKLL